MDTIYKVMLHTILSFAALFILAKVNGKKQIAQLEFIDYIIGISIGSIAAQMTVDSTIPYYYFLLAMAIFSLLDIAFSLLSRKAVFLKTIINGTPLILVEEGRIVYKNLKKSRLDVNELLALCRLKNYFNLKDIYYCIQEMNGQISILPSACKTPTVIQDIKADFKPATLSVDFVVDGKVVEAALNQAGKTRQWLFDKLNIKDDKAVKNILLATYDEGNDIVDVHIKE